MRVLLVKKAAVSVRLVLELCDSAQGRESQVQRIFREELFQGLGIGQVICRDDLVDLKGRERRVCQGIRDLFCNGVKNGGRNSLA